MKKLIRLLVLPLTAITLLIGSSACSNEKDDEIITPAPDGFAKDLIGEWEIAGFGTVTFTGDGTGFMTIDDMDEEEMAVKSKMAPMLSRGSYTVRFTWNYNPTTHKINFDLEGESMTWTVIDYHNGVIEIIDDEGESLTINRKGESPDQPVLPEYTIGPAEWLIGKWGVAGSVQYEFTENGFMRQYYLDSEDGWKYESTPYTYNEDLHLITFKESYQNFNVTALTKEYIRLGSGEYNFFLSRISDDETFTVGSLSLIYDKTLVAMGVASLDDEPVTMSMTIFANKTITMLPGGKMNYSYDANTHILTLSMFGEEVRKMKIINLTSTDLIFEWIPEEDDTEGTISRMEYRVL